MASFRGERAFLSNFFSAPISFRFRGVKYNAKTVEHAFAALKSENRADIEYVLNAETPAQAKKRGREIDMRSDFKQMQLELMLLLLRKKFAIPHLRQKLLAEEGEIVEVNEWHDTFWGVCNGVGENHLGKLLMQVRDEISSSR